MRLTIDQSAIANIRTVVEQLGGNINKELAASVNKAAKKTQLEAARALNKAIPVPVRVLKKATGVSKLANADSGSAEITLKYGHPIPLKYFKPRKTKTGLTFQVRRGEKRQTQGRSLFVVGKYKQHVFKRQGLKKRGPLERMNGPAPGEVYQEAGVVDIAKRTASERLPIEVNARIKYLVLKANGQLRGKQTQRANR